MKKNGFTLIELLAVIIILGIIALIAVISVGSILSDSKNSLSETQQKNVEESAKTYYIKEGMSQGVSCVNVSQLIEKGYIEGTTVIDPKTNKEMNGSVLITYESNQYNYQYQESTCQFKTYYANGEAVYFDVAKGLGCTKEEYESSYGKASNYNPDGDLYEVDDYLNSSTGYNGITKTSELQNSCLKFYAFNDTGSDKVNLLLDHNTTAPVVWTRYDIYENTSGPKELLEVLKTDTENWKGTETPTSYSLDQSNATSGAKYTINYTEYKARIITAEEIAQITGNASWNVTSESSDLYYFDSLTTIASDTCKYDWRTNTGDTSGCKYGWLYDRTVYDCTNWGCLNNLGDETNGYWTISSQASDSYGAWAVYPGLFQTYSVDSDGDFHGVRPVIEVLKSKL